MEVFVAIIELKNITKTFEQDGKIFDAVKDASVSINKGEIYGIIGFSGAGKGTLMKRLLDTYDNYALSIFISKEASKEFKDSSCKISYIQRS